MSGGSRLTVLGSCGAWPEPDRACNGYVLEHAGFRIVIDLGDGTVTRLLQHLSSTAADGIDAVVNHITIRESARDGFTGWVHGSWGAGR